MIESNCPPDKIEEALLELTLCQLVEYEDRFLWVKNRIKHINGGSPNTAKAVKTIIKQLPDTLQLKQNVKDFYLQNPVKWLNLDSPSEAPPKPLRSPYQAPTKPLPNPSEGGTKGTYNISKVKLSNKPNSNLQPISYNNKKKETNTKKTDTQHIINTFNAALNQNAKPTRTNNEIITELLQHHKPHQLTAIIQWAATNTFWKNSNGLKTIAGLERNLDKIITAKLTETNIKNLNTKKEPTP